MYGASKDESATAAASDDDVYDNLHGTYWSNNRTVMTLCSTMLMHVFLVVVYRFAEKEEMGDEDDEKKMS